ncbi:unnamed protein product [Lactuca saligna]|uniref:X8 domain-containing protein n=1 Tax=Lactuca saligna TaxID=75948 RepID=A0AA36E8Y7_LACSI|nr:unnamed protein product [Lactuca saligna]
MVRCTTRNRCGLRGSTRLKKGKDRSSEAAVTSDEKKETKQRGCSSSVLEGVAKGKEIRKGKKETRRILVFLGSNRRMRRRNNRGGLRVVVYCPTAQSQAAEAKLQQVLDYLCGEINRKEIQPRGSCFNPNIVQNHVSYAIDHNFQINGVCDISYATPAVTDAWHVSTHK